MQGHVLVRVLSCKQQKLTQLIIIATLTEVTQEMTGNQRDKRPDLDYNCSRAKGWDPALTAAGWHTAPPRHPCLYHMGEKPLLLQWPPYPVPHLPASPHPLLQILSPRWEHPIVRRPMSTAQVPKSRLFDFPPMGGSWACPPTPLSWSKALALPKGKMDQLKKNTRKDWPPREVAWRWRAEATIGIQDGSNS